MTSINSRSIAGNIIFDVPTKTHQSALRIIQKTSFNKFLAQYGHLQQTALLKMWMKHLFVSASASKELNNMKLFLRDSLLENAPETPFDGPLKLEVIYSFNWLKGHSSKDKEKGSIYKATKPDVDNLVKVFMDALEGANFITNDSRFAVMILQKQYADWSGIKYRICELNNI